jgi:hypothetical protein
MTKKNAVAKKIEANNADVAAAIAFLDQEIAEEAARSNIIDIDQAILDATEVKLGLLEAQTSDLTIATEEEVQQQIIINLSQNETMSFDDLIAGIAEADKLAKAVAIGTAFDDRLAYLAKEKPGNLNQPKTLTKYRGKLALPSKAAALLVTGTDETFINRSTSGDSRYNVYAIDKLIDVVNALTGGQLGNAVNKAILKSMVNFKQASIAFDGRMAQAATSDKITVSDKKMAALLNRHNVAANTASTQTSSTMSALQTLGIVINKGSAKFPIYELTDTPASQKVQNLIAA